MISARHFSPFCIFLLISTRLFWFDIFNPKAINKQARATGKKKGGLKPQRYELGFLVTSLLHLVNGNSVELAPCSSALLFINHDGKQLHGFRTTLESSSSEDGG